jgi:hypothetical protein
MHSCKHAFRGSARGQRSAQPSQNHPHIICWCGFFNPPVKQCMNNTWCKENQVHAHKTCRQQTEQTARMHAPPCQPTLHVSHELPPQQFTASYCTEPRNQAVPNNLPASDATTPSTQASVSARVPYPTPCLFNLARRSSESQPIDGPQTAAIHARGSASQPFAPGCLSAPP